MKKPAYFADENLRSSTDILDYIYLLEDYDIEVDGEIFNIEPEICKPIIKASKNMQAVQGILHGIIPG